MSIKDKEMLDHELQALSILYDSLYARGLVGISKNSVQLIEDVFEEMVRDETKMNLGDGHVEGITIGGLRITTVRD